MSLSLRDQLLKSGLVTEKQVKQAAKQKNHTKPKKQPDQKQLTAVQLQAQRALQEKALQDKQLNLEKEEKAQRKAILSQIKQLIESHRLPKLTTDDYFNFADHKKVKRISVNTLIREKLSAGTLAIVRYGSGYEIVPADIACKIQERNSKYVIVFNKAAPSTEVADDPYAAFQVPDDLMW